MEKPLISMIEVQLRSFVGSLQPADEEIRKRLDFGYSWDGQSALLFEIRPQWNDFAIRHALRNMPDSGFNGNST